MLYSTCDQCGKPIKYALIVLLCDTCLFELSVSIKQSKTIVCLEQVWTRTSLEECGHKLPCPVHRKEAAHEAV